MVWFSGYGFCLIRLDLLAYWFGRLIDSLFACGLVVLWYMFASSSWWFGGLLACLVLVALLMLIWLVYMVAWWFVVWGCLGPAYFGCYWLLLGVDCGGTAGCLLAGWQLFVVLYCAF